MPHDAHMPNTTGTTTQQCKCGRPMLITTVSRPALGVYKGAALCVGCLMARSTCQCRYQP